MRETSDSLYHRTSNGGYNLLPAKDHAGSMAAQVPSLPGYIDVIVHGNSTEIGTRSGPAVNGLYAANAGLRPLIL